MAVSDVSEQDFQTAVLDRSHEVPVVVDFWAAWCGPCRQLGPLLEREAAARADQVELAKIDTDANQGLAQRYGIQGIPAVKAFVDGEVVDEFVGAQGPAVVGRFFDGLVPSEADGLVATGDEASLRRALELEPGRADASLALARLLHARGEDDAALALLEAVPGSFAVAGLAARICLESDTDRPELSAAFAALDEGRVEAGLDGLLAALAAPDPPTDALRAAIVGVLDELGVEHPVARDARRRLAAALY